MKTTLLPLLSAGALAWSLAGCATASTAPEARLEPGHTLEARTAVHFDLPLGEGDQPGPALMDWSAKVPVVGMGESEVLQTIGRPGQRLTPEIWIYWRYYSPEQAAEAGGHDTLVVSFAQGKVSGMKLVNGELLQRHLAGRRQRAPLNEL